MLTRVVTSALLCLGAAASVQPAAARFPAPIDRAIQDVKTAELKQHIAVLASDRLAGRGVGHAGNREAETYIAGALRDANVSPAAPNYTQPVEVYEPHLGSNSTLTIQGAETPLSLRPGADYLPLPESSDVAVAGPLRFAGYGISAPSLRHDDYANIDVKGAIVLALDGAPDTLLPSSGLSNDDQLEIVSVDRKADDARAHGARGLIVVRSYLGEVRTAWPDRSSVRAANYRLYAQMRDSPLAAAAISEKAAEPARRALESGRALQAELNPDVIARPIVMDNILGIVEGRRAGADIIVVGAHMDHDGIDEAGQIYNGADDNASGTAAVMAIAAAFTHAAAEGTRPARAIVFALWNGEEKGELGAEYYVQHPLPARQLAANINLDMIGRNEDIPNPDDPRYRGFARTTAADNTNVVHLLGYTYAPDLALDAEQANESIHLTIKQDYDRDSQSLVRRSDNWPFLQRGIPAVFLTTGLHPDYHTPEDDTGRLDFAKLARITQLAARLVWIAAEGDAPRFKSQSNDYGRR